MQADQCTGARQMLKKLVIAWLLLASPALAQGKTFTLQAPPALIETGLMKHILPRFSLKKGIRITLIDSGADAQFGATGTPVFRQTDTLWHFASNDTPHAATFLDWLTSDVGKRTIDTFQPDGTQIFSSDVAPKVEEQIVELTGDVAWGEKVSLTKCGRCHVVNETNRMNAIGSTPSFALLRSFDDWDSRFQAFFVLKPHGAFTQVEGITEPFPENLPSPIAPIEVTVDEIDAILAYVNTIEPADLGAPIQAGSAFQSP